MLGFASSAQPTRAELKPKSEEKNELLIGYRTRKGFSVDAGKKTKSSNQGANTKPEIRFLKTDRLHRPGR